MSTNTPMLTGNSLTDLPNLIEMAKCKHSKFQKKEDRPWRLIAVNRAFHADLWERLEEIEEEESRKRPSSPEESVGAKKEKEDSEDTEDSPRPEGSDEFSDQWLKDIEEYDGFEDWEEDSDD